MAAQGYSFSLGNPQQQRQQQGYGIGGNSRMPFEIPSGGVYGQQKWMPGNGTDIFLPRGSPITAKTGGRVLLAQGGTGLQQGAEMIVQFDDGTVARFRHVQPQTNGQFRPGQVLGVVNDSSMDMLSRQVASQIGAPDGFQHLDLSINRPGNIMFSPQGGGGGDISASQWLSQMGYQGRVVPRTPGPQEGMSGGFGGPGGPMGMPGGPGGFPGFGGGPPGMGGPGGPMGMPPNPFMMGGPGGPGMGGPGGGGAPFGGSPMGMGSFGGPGMGSPGGLGLGPSSFGKMASPGMGFGFGGPGGGAPGGMGFGAPMGMPPNPFMMMQPPGFGFGGPGMGGPPPMMGPPPPSFGNFGAGPSPMGMGLGGPFGGMPGNPFSMGGPGGAASMMMNPFGGLGPAGAASMYGA